MNETFTKEQMASREMFDKQQAITINLSKIDEMDMNQFIGTCDHFDPNDKLDYQLPTPIEIYETFSSYNEYPAEGEEGGEAKDTFENANQAKEEESKSKENHDRENSQSTNQDSKNDMPDTSHKELTSN